MITAVDTNILLDILIPNTKYASASKRLLDEALAQGALVISEVVYAELASLFPTPRELEKFLTDTQIQLEHSSPQALQQAGEAWKAYVRARSYLLHCSQCGKAQRFHCSSCGELIAVRQHILSDFLIGAHALLHADQLLTRDLGYYKRYFKALKVVSPRV